ncbi:hypothetical protein VPH35_140708 [Triticum aestivum]
MPPSPHDLYRENERPCLDASSVRSARTRAGPALGFQRRRRPRLAAAGTHSRRSPASSTARLPLCPLPQPGQREAAAAPLCTGCPRRLRPEAADHPVLHSSTVKMTCA